jgi:hypothetical protein
VFSSLVKLECLALLPSSDGDGLHDDHVAGLSFCSTRLRSLSLRGSLEQLSDEGVHALAAATALRGLTRLSIMPLGRSLWLGLVRYSSFSKGTSTSQLGQSQFLG